MQPDVLDYARGQRHGFGALGIGYKLLFALNVAANFAGVVFVTGALITTGYGGAFAVVGSIVLVPASIAILGLTTGFVLFRASALPRTPKVIVVLMAVFTLVLSSAALTLGFLRHL
jgi:hypothetical protein